MPENTVEQSNTLENVITTPTLPLKQEKEGSSILSEIIFLLIGSLIGAFMLSASFAHINKLGDFEPEEPESNANLNNSIKKTNKNLNELKSKIGGFGKYCPSNHSAIVP